MPVVLSIDDRAESLRIRKLMLETDGFSVLTATSGAYGLKLLAENPVDVVVLDYRMPEMDGFAVANVIRDRYGKLPVLLLTAYPEEVPQELHRIVNSFVTKGESPEALLGELWRLTGGAPANARP